MKPEAWADFTRDCAIVRELLSQREATNLESLRWYDLPLREVVTSGGMARVERWNRHERRPDEIAENYDLVSLYWAPPLGDGLERSGATVWSCEALDSRPWHDGESATRRLLEANAEDIIAEYQDLTSDLETHPDNASLVDRGRWTGLFFYGVRGWRNDALCARCPTTTRILEHLPLCRNFGFAMFSGLEPHTHVQAHCGSSNLRLRHHLGIQVPEPEASRLRVGREWRGWARGAALAFDDSFEHEVVHEGEETRVVLVVDVWHPDLSAEDIAVLSHPVFQRFGRVPRGAPEPERKHGT